MGMSCLCSFLLKTLNILFLLIGLAIAGLGAFLQAAGNSTIVVYLQKELTTVLSSYGLVSSTDVKVVDTLMGVIEPAAVSLLVVGLALASIAFIGCCGAACDSKMLLIIYTIILASLIAVQAIIVAVFFTHKFDEKIKDQVSTTLTDQYVDIDDSGLFSVAWNFFMIQFQCCGLNNVTDFNSVTHWNRTRVIIINGQQHVEILATPVACCATTGIFPKVTVINDYCALYPNSTISNWDKGCWVEVSTWVEQYSSGAIAVISMIIVVQAIIMAMTIFIIRDLSKSKVSPI